MSVTVLLLPDANNTHYVQRRLDQTQVVPFDNRPHFVDVLV